MEENNNSIWLDVILTHANIDRFVILPNRAHVFGRQFLGAPLSLSGWKRGPSSAAEGKEKKKARLGRPLLMLRSNLQMSQAPQGVDLRRLPWRVVEKIWAIPKFYGQLR